MATFINSTSIPESMKTKRKLVQATIAAQVGHVKPNLKRNESAPISDIDAILDSKPTLKTRNNTLF